MDEKLMIIITGASATGKTHLSRCLADKFRIPVINKDEIKELLFNYLGIKDEKWAMRLGVASFELIYLFAEKLCLTAKPFIVEGNFENKYASKVFTELKSKYNYKVLQIYCHAEAEVLYHRYVERDNSGERHPGHIIQISDVETFRSRLNSKNFKLGIEDCKTINLDTTLFQNINLQQIYEKVYKNLKSESECIS